MELTSVPRFVAALRGRRVFVTGHTGFKGSWMVQLLSALGCEIFGYALSPATDPNLFELSSSKALLVTSTIGDVRDAYRLSAAIRDAKPDLVIHMAAQALVRRGYAQPMATWDTNVMGTVNLLEGLRASHDVRGVVVVTSDKCYENHNWEWGYRESDPPVPGAHGSMFWTVSRVIFVLRRRFSMARRAPPPHSILDRRITTISR